MLKTIRRGVFETNSSSTHSITMCSKEDYDKWQNGEMFYYDERLVSREEAIKELKNNKWFNKENPDFDFTNEEEINEALIRCNYESSEQYWDDEYLESFEDTYTTKSGETIIAFGKYGYDG